MIAVTRLDGVPIMVNEDLVLTIEQTPDTVLCFTNGEKLLVQESPEELVVKALQFRRRIVRDASGESTSA